MMKILQSLTAQKIIIVGGIALCCATGKVAYNQFNNRKHPLLQYSRELLLRNSIMKKEMAGRNLKYPWFITRISNPDNHEIGFEYSLKGKNGKIRILVIGDSMTHRELVTLAGKKKELLDRSESHDRFVTNSLADSLYTPVNISRFFIVEEKYLINYQNEIISGDQNIWRLKQCFVETVSDRFNLVPAETFEEIALSLYKMRLFKDLLIPRNAVLSQLEKANGPAMRESFSISNFLYNILFFSAVIMAGSLFMFKIFTSNSGKIMNSSIYLQTLIKCKSSVSLSQSIGKYKGIIGLSGFVFPKFGIARMSFYIYGSKGRQTVYLKKMPIHALKKEWDKSNLYFYDNNNKIEI